MVSTEINEICRKIKKVLESHVRLPLVVVVTEIGHHQLYCSGVVRSSWTALTLLILDA